MHKSGKNALFDLGNIHNADMRISHGIRRQGYVSSSANFKLSSNLNTFEHTLNMFGGKYMWRDKGMCNWQRLTILPIECRIASRLTDTLLASEATASNVMQVWLGNES